MCQISDISNIQIYLNSKSGKTAQDYKNYLIAYREFTNKKRKFAPGSTAKVDSQFSETIAADLFGFHIDHSRGGDGINPQTNETYEVKGSGYSNNKVRFNLNNRADHVIWVKIRRKSIEIREIDTDIYNHLDNNGFVNINKIKKDISLNVYSY